MKIYKDKYGVIYIVVGKGENEPQVCIAKDDGVSKRGRTNMFGEQLDRFSFHHASLWGNTPYTSRTDCLIDEDDKAYQYKLVRIKKIKSLGRRK